MKFSRPRGTRDFLPDDMEKRRNVENIMRSTFESFGYREILTPTFETLELITAKSGEEIIKSLFDFTDKSGRRLALRPEITAPVMRVYIEKLSKKPKPIKLYYIANCFRYERPQSGRYREFWQAGVEIIGSKYAEAEAEIVALADTTLKKLGLKEYEIHVGHVGILRKILEEQGVDEKEQNRILNAIDKGEKNKIENFKIIPEIIEMIGDESEVLPKISELLKNSIANKELQKFKEFLRFLKLYNVKFKVNLGIARGLDYYTGMVFEIYSPKLGAEKQICGGGTYSLTHVFGGEPTPTCGFAFGFDRIILALEKEKKIAEKEKIKFFIIPLDQKLWKEAIKIAMKIREKYQCEIDLMRRKLKKALSYASSMGYSYVIIIGEEEISKGEVVVKDMKKKTQVRIKLEEIICNPTLDLK